MIPGSVVLLATEPDDSQAGRDWMDLLRRFLGAPRDYAIFVLTYPGSALQSLSAQPGLTIAAEAAPQGSSFARASALRRRLKALPPESAWRVIATHSDAEHYAAIWHKLATPAPIAVFKTQFHVPHIAKTKFNKWRFGKITDANLIRTREEETTLRTPGDADRARLYLDRPFVVGWPVLAEDSSLKRLDHAFLSLLAPTRVDPLNGPKRSFAHIELAYITHFYSNQTVNTAVGDLLSRYAKYDPALLDRIHFVIVDDGSPLQTPVPDLPLNLTWLRVREDIPWNQPGARNLGAVYAKSDKILITDLDHEFPEDTLRKLVERRSPGKRIRKFWRRRSDGGYYECHPNTFFLSRGRFLELYGYEEEFCGGYASDDIRFIKFQKVHGTLVNYLPKDYWCTEREIDRKRGYHSLARDHSINTSVDSRKRLELEHFGPATGHSRMFLNFTWDVVVQRWRDVTIQFPRKAWWKSLQALRQVLPRF
jgi:hypothetical protein